MKIHETRKGAFQGWKVTSASGSCMVDQRLTLDDWDYTHGGGVFCVFLHKVLVLIGAIY
jgi:hypothetical protein